MYIRANTTFELAQEVFGCIDKIEKADSPEGEIAFVTAQLPYGEIIEKSQHSKAEVQRLFQKSA